MLNINICHVDNLIDMRQISFYDVNDWYLNLICNVIMKCFWELILHVELLNLFFSLVGWGWDFFICVLKKSYEREREENRSHWLWSPKVIYILIFLKKKKRKKEIHAHTSGYRIRDLIYWRAFAYRYSPLRCPKMDCIRNLLNGWNSLELFFRKNYFTRSFTNKKVFIYFFPFNFLVYYFEIW